MYKIFVKTKTNRDLLQPNAKTIKAAKARYCNTMLNQPFGLSLDDIDEIVVFRGNKIHGYYDQYFKLKSNVPADIHNLIYG
jgi:hypothetical protein